MAGRKQSGRWLGLYTAVYLCAAAALGLVLVRYGRVLVWNPDGVKQHYTAVGYVGQALRELLAGRGLPMMSFSLGQGMDVLTSCAYCGYTDPLSLLAGLAPVEATEWALLAAEFIRLYLAGAFFGLYAVRVGSRDGWATACGAAIYAFCGYFVCMMSRHPYFINGGLYLPLMLLGIERVLDGRRWLMYVLVTALMLVVSFYLSYMNTVFAILYIIVRLCFRLRERGVRESAVDGLVLLGGYFLGAALAAAVLLPIVTVYLGNSRIGVQAGYDGSMLHYPAEWYRKLLAYAFGPWDSPGDFMFANFAPLALFGVLPLFGQRGARARQTRVALYICAAAACVPMAGWVLNGMAYVSSRWSYIMALFVALGCTVGLPRLFSAKSRCRRPVAIVAILYGLFQAAHCVLFHDAKKQLVAPICIWAFAAFLLVYDGGGVKALTRRRARRLSAGFLAATSALWVLIGFMPQGYGAITQQMKVGVYEQVSSGAGGQMVETDGVHRIAQGFYDDPSSLMLGYMGTSYYWSLVDGGNSRYYTALGLPTQSTTYHLYNLGGSAPMNAVAAVKYFVSHDDDRYVIPYGFEPTGERLALADGSGAGVYENGLALPMGYAYDATLSRTDYDALPVEDRLQALVARAIVEDGTDAGAVPQARFSGAAETVEYAVTEQVDAQWTSESLRGAEGGRIHLAFDAPEDAEVYLIMEGVEIASLNRLQDGVITVESEAGLARANVPHPNSNFYFPKPVYAFCLGTGPLDGCDIGFSRTMDYVYDDIRLVAVPLAGYREDVEARRGEGLEDVALSRDALSGKISVPGDRVLQIAVPYSTGWRAWVDGAERPIFRCGGMYMGIALEAGSHEIEMRYVTPGLRLGAAISAAALLLTAALAAIGAVRRRKRGE